MRLLVTATKIGGRLVPAGFVCDASVVALESGKAELVVGNESLPPSAEQVAYYEILEATQTELNRLRRNGYHLKLAWY